MGEKLYYILHIIKQQTKPISAKKIREALVTYNIYVDIKTIYATIEKINAFYSLLTGEVYIEAIHRKGYGIKHSYFEDGELQFLLDSIGFNQNLSYQEIDKLQEKLIAMSNASQMQHISCNKPKQEEQDFSLLLSLSTLLKAVIKKQPIYFQYVSYQIEKHHLHEVASKRGNLTINEQNYYIISPYKVILRNGHYYVLGYFDKRKEQLSMYRIDRMRLIRHHKSQFIDIRERFDVDKDLEKNVNMFVYDKMIDVTFRFKDSILREVVNQFGTDMEIHQEPDQWYTATIKDVAMSKGLLGWIMMLQEQIEIVLPLELRDAIITKIDNMKKLYQR
jgi:predicted DNA-binding transcriptional regulator YafY